MTENTPSEPNNTGTGYKDRNGRYIEVGDTLKWVREAEYFKTGSKAGKLKQAASEFIAGKVVETDMPGNEYWCAKLDDEGNPLPPDDDTELPPGLNFISMLKYIEVVED